MDSDDLLYMDNVGEATLVSRGTEDYYFNLTI